jgi:hypothetical protein
MTSSSGWIWIKYKNVNIPNKINTCSEQMGVTNITPRLSIPSKGQHLLVMGQSACTSDAKN